MEGSGMKQFSASKYVSYKTLMGMSDADRKKLEEQLDKKVKAEIEASDDVVDKKVQRKWVTSVMIKIERIAKPVVREQSGYDITKIFKS
jgi:hypothetical protein